MHDAFVPMRVWLRAGVDPEIDGTEPVASAETETMVEALSADPQAHANIDAAIDEVKRFRASLEDAVDACVQELLRDIAVDVLGRELLLAPCDLHTVVARALSRYGIDPVRLRIRAEEAPTLESFGVPLIADDTLRSGDVILEALYGTIDASLGMRLDRVLARAHA